jgi:hypothetical protein
MQYITLKYNYTQLSHFQILLYLLICFYLAVYWVPIKSHQSNQTHSTNWPTLLICKYSSDFIPCCNLQYMYIYNLSSLRTIYTKYSNSCIYILVKKKNPTHSNWCSYLIWLSNLVQLLNDLNRHLLLCTCMFDYNFKKLFYFVEEFEYFV